MIEVGWKIPKIPNKQFMKLLGLEFVAVLQTDYVDKLDAVRTGTWHDGLGRNSRPKLRRASSRHILHLCFFTFAPRTGGLHSQGRCLYYDAVKIWKACCASGTCLYVAAMSTCIQGIKDGKSPAVSMSFAPFERRLVSLLPCLKRKPT